MNKLRLLPYVLALLISVGYGLYVPARDRVTSIPIVQGKGATSPLEGQQVTVEGVVVGNFRGADELNGFFLQDPKGDGDPDTSDGIFIFIPQANEFSKVATKKGDLVQVSGRVAEYQGQTQIDHVSALTIRGNAPLPAPVEIQLPRDGGQRLERFESMLVTIPQTLTVSGTKTLARFGEVVVSANGRLLHPNNFEEVSAEENATRRIVIDDGSSRRDPRPVPYLRPNGTLRTGDTVDGVTGVLTEAFAAYRIHPTQKISFDEGNPRPQKPESVGGDVTVAAFNVENYFTTLRSENRRARGAATPEEFEQQSARVIAALRGLDADVVGLIEIENNGQKAIEELLRRLNAVYGKKVYASVSEPDQGTGTDAIRMGIIYKPDRVQLVGQAQSDSSPVYERPPVAQTFRVPGHTASDFTVIVNHFKSKGGCPKEGDIDTGEGCWAVRREEQARELAAFSQRLEKGAAEGRVLVTGDLNAYAREAPLRILQKAGFTNPKLRLPAQRQYSYVFDGQAGSLDYILAGPRLRDAVSGVTVWHINADEPELPDELRTPGPFRSSDHDPVIVGLHLGKAQ